MNGSWRYGRLTLAALIFLGAAGVALWQQQEWRAAQRDAARLEGELAALRQERETAEGSLAIRRGKLAEAREQSTAEATKLGKALQAVEPALAAAAWARPPTQVPVWDPASPFVWLRKEMLPQLPIQVFDSAGKLNPDTATMLAISPQLRQRLDAVLARFLAESQNAEAARAALSDEHLVGGSSDEGEKLTVRVPPMPDQGARLQQDFEDALRAELGAGRAELIEKVAADWLNSHFSQFGREERIISVLRRPDGTHEIAVKSGRSFFLTSGMASIDGYVPGYLRAFFDPLTGPLAKPTAETP